MKTLYLLILSFLFINVYSQTNRSSHRKITGTKNYRSNIRRNVSNNQIEDTAHLIQPRETATDRYLKGTHRKESGTDTATKSKGNTNSFARGIHPAANAGEKFDTVSKKINVNNVNTGKVLNNPIAGSNDTIFNTNTITTNGISTNSGAVDRSGQAQFGQSNWGNSRRTVGESQWTVPPPVTTSFTKEFPSAGNLSWTRNDTDTSIYSARYKSGNTWITTNYSVSGKRLDMRTEVPMTLLPQPVNTYVTKLPNNLQISNISKWEVLGKPDVYEIETRTGKTMYVNSEGTEVSH